MAGAFQKAELELLLKNKGLGSALPAVLPKPELMFATGIEALDNLLSGGFPRGHISEITGPVSSGKTTLLLSLLSRATQQGEIVACIDADTLDPLSASHKKIDLKKLLWVRCRKPDQILKAADIVCRAGKFSVIALDLHGFPGLPARRWSALWFRLQRAVEGTQTVLLVLAPRSVARNAARLSVRLQRKDLRWQGQQAFWKLPRGFRLQARVVRGPAGANMGAAAIQVRFDPRLLLCPAQNDLQKGQRR